MKVRHCSTGHLAWAIIDIPGERKYLSNMLTGEQQI